MEKQRQINVVIIGCTGFVGSAILKTALDKYADHMALHALVRESKRRVISPSVKVVEGSLPDDLPTSLFPQKPHVVLYYATKTIDNDQSGFQENEKNMAALLNALPDICCGLIYGSSMSVYGQGEQDGITEYAVLNGDTALAASRISVEHMIMKEMNRHKKSAFILRPRFIVGQNDKYTLPNWISMVKNNTILGNGQQKFSIIHVNDYAEIILLLALSMYNRFETGTPLSTPFNIGYSKPITLQEIVQIICKHKNLPYPGRTIPINLKLFKILRFFPFRRLQNTITMLALGGISHFGDTQAIVSEIGSDIIYKNPVDVFSNIVSNYGDN